MVVRVVTRLVARLVARLRIITKLLFYFGFYLRLDIRTTIIILMHLGHLQLPLVHLLLNEPLLFPLNVSFISLLVQSPVLMGLLSLL